MIKGNKKYKVYAIKYEELFERIEELDILFDINLDKKIKLETKLETKRNNVHVDELNNIYNPLITKMNKNNFIEII